MAGTDYSDFGLCAIWSSPPEIGSPFDSIVKNFLFGSEHISTVQSPVINNGCSTFKNENDWEMTKCNNGSVTFSIPEDNYQFIVSRFQNKNDSYNYSYRLFDYSQNQNLLMAVIKQDCDGWAVFGEDTDTMRAITNAFYMSTGMNDELNYYRDHFVTYSTVSMAEFGNESYDPNMNSMYGINYQNNYTF